LSVLHNAPLWEKSVHVTGLLPICYYFQLGETFILGKNGIQCCFSELYVTALTKGSKLECWVFCTMFPFESWMWCHRNTPYLSPFSILRNIHFGEECHTKLFFRATWNSHTNSSKLECSLWSSPLRTKCAFHRITSYLSPFQLGEIFIFV
jgi:hypothetical protein